MDFAEDSIVAAGACGRDVSEQLFLGGVGDDVDGGIVDGKLDLDA